MSRKLFSSVVGLILFAGTLATQGSARAQTPGTIVKFADDLTGADSVITEDPVTHNIGIGSTTPPAAKLTLEDDVSTFNGTTIMLYNRAGGNTNRWVLGTGGCCVPRDGFSIGDSTDYRLIINGNGNVGIGTIPDTKLHVHGGSIGLGTAGLKLSHPLGSKTYTLMPGIPGANESGFSIYDYSGGYERGNLFVINTEGNVGIGTPYPGAKLDVNGMVKAAAVQITGADFSEKFQVRETKGRREPGMVVAIDAENPGKLVLSASAYNRRVAGILSGAGGINPGMLMGQPGTLADGDQPVALSGRVYVWADVSNGPIVPGDLLTTSNVPGHAMRVTNYAKAQGATIGKVMTSLKEGKGLVLVLVTLQ